jgi:hypothetical protein
MIGGARGGVRRALGWGVRVSGGLECPRRTLARYVAAHRLYSHCDTALSKIVGQFELHPCDPLSDQIEYAMDIIRQAMRKRGRRNLAPRLRKSVTILTKFEK